MNNTSIDIQAVRAYNKRLKECQDRAAKLKTEVEYTEKEIKRACEELTNELGIQVTPENIESIRDEHVASLNNALLVGNEILERLKQQEGGQSAGTVYQAPVNMGMTGNMGGVPVMVTGAMPGNTGVGTTVNPNDMNSAFGALDI